MAERVCELSFCSLWISDGRSRQSRGLSVGEGMSNRASAVMSSAAACETTKAMRAIFSFGKIRKYS